MKTEILEGFDRLRELRDWARGKIVDAYAPQREEIDALAADLEAWARNAPAGNLLDRVCNFWLTGQAAWVDTSTYAPLIYDSDHPSTDPAAAMELLEAMQAAAWRICDDPGVGIELGSSDEDRWVRVTGSYRQPIELLAEATGDNYLAIARACAVLCARGIERKGVE